MNHFRRLHASRIAIGVELMRRRESTFPYHHIFGFKPAHEPWAEDNFSASGWNSKWSRARLRARRLLYCVTHTDNSNNSNHWLFRSPIECFQRLRLSRVAS